VRWPPRVVPVRGGTEFAEERPALRVICPRCQEEGKPCLLVTIDVPGDEREIHGLCWTHRLRLLAKGTGSAVSRDPGNR
jgi:hypothetical protein